MVLNIFDSIYYFCWKSTYLQIQNGLFRTVLAFIVLYIGYKFVFLLRKWKLYLEPFCDHFNSKSFLPNVFIVIAPEEHLEDAWNCCSMESCGNGICKRTLTVRCRCPLVSIFAGFVTYQLWTLYVARQGLIVHQVKVLD
jgi:hypothetical protein